MLLTSGPEGFSRLVGGALTSSILSDFQKQVVNILELLRGTAVTVQRTSTFLKHLLSDLRGQHRPPLSDHFPVTLEPHSALFVVVVAT